MIKMAKSDALRYLHTLRESTVMALIPSNEIIAFDMAVSALEMQEQDRWTPCSERLPEVGQRVLVQHKDGSMAVRRCIDGGHLAWFFANTVAWRSAPEPYKE